MAPRAAPGLDLDQDLAFQTLSWRLERIGAWGMVLVVVAACLGLLGSGPLSQGQAEVDPLHVRFPRFSRLQSSETLEVRIGGSAVQGQEARLWIDGDYLRETRIESILPTPARVEATVDRVVFAFAVAEPGRPLTVTMSLQPQRVGVMRAALGLEPAASGARLGFRQVVYP